MKTIIFKLVLPLTIISFAVFTKWWYALVTDGPDEILTGFPLPFVCNGWHTSLSLQIFCTEFIIDFLTYFSFWFIISAIIHKFIIPIRFNQLLSYILICVSSLVLGLSLIIASNPDNIFHFKRNFDMEIMETGYTFIWEEIERPDFYKYHPERRYDK